MDKRQSVAGETVRGGIATASAGVTTTGGARRKPTGVVPLMLASPTAVTTRGGAASPQTNTISDATTSPTSTTLGQRLLAPARAALRGDGRVTSRYQTFFEDSTPPPSPSYVGRSSLSNNNAETGWGHAPLSAPLGLAPKNEGYDYRYDHVAPPAPIPKAKGFMGLSRRACWIVLGLIAMVILALAVGLGVGLSTSHSSSSSSLSDKQADGNDSGVSSSQTATATKEATATTTEAATETTTSAIPSTTQTVVDVDDSDACPMANNTLYNIEGSTKQFLRLCGVDYSGDGGADDLGIVYTVSMQDCMVNCAGYDGCTACSWGILADDGARDNHRCWLKTNLGKAQKARASWDFAILQ
ncbi:hypothetical protein GMORB2_1834 [Geosmithia morbida]|uniref:Apple domain-containing protein n=1 Tax=Geosmithia morbida TaxID=1094350 RepID=A0A9P5D0B3_9HYPO|nr:uncharacterized protein GMORB2_1834 [Geosmithia morbida]KAF4121427.1 hypothetical protein GMORB2_1834 [Geosmithia morbida]